MRLRATLREWPEVHIIEDIQQPELALRIAAQEHPDLIFMASDQAEVAPVSLARDLRVASATSQIIMIGHLLKPEEHRQLAAIDLAGFLQWTCVTADRLRNVVEAVRDGEVRAASKGAVRALGEPERLQGPHGQENLTLTEKERATVLGLACGQTQQQIAVSEGVSRRTIEDRIAGLKEKFDVPTTFMLGVIAARWGFVP